MSARALGFAWGKFDLDDVRRHRRRQVKDGGVAWQMIAGVRYALNPNVDLGLKYRYFHPSRMTEDVATRKRIPTAGSSRIRCWRR